MRHGPVRVADSCWRRPAPTPPPGTTRPGLEAWSAARSAARRRTGPAGAGPDQLEKALAAHAGGGRVTVTADVVGARPGGRGHRGGDRAGAPAARVRAVLPRVDTARDQPDGAQLASPSSAPSCGRTAGRSPRGPDGAGFGAVPAFTPATRSTPQSSTVSPSSTTVKSYRPRRPPPSAHPVKRRGPTSAGGRLGVGFFELHRPRQDAGGLEVGASTSHGCGGGSRPSMVRAKVSCPYGARPAG